MKKKKQDELTDAMITHQVKSIDGVDSNEDNIRSRVNAEGTGISFKKSLYGYEMQDVDKYIDQQNQNLASVCRVYDTKIKDLKNELALCYRERDSLRVSYEECRRELNTLTAAKAVQEVSTKSETNNEAEKIYAEYEKKISDLNDSLAKAIYENERLRVFQQQSAELTNKNAVLEGELASLRQKKNDMLLELAKLSQLTSENEKLFAENTALKAQRSDVEKQLTEAKKATDEKEERIKELTNEGDILKRHASELEINCSVMQQKSEKAEDEVDKLKDINKKQAYDFAAKVNELEGEYNNGRLTLQKQLQVHTYHIKQMQVALDELNKQFSEVKTSLNVTEISK